MSFFELEDINCYRNHFFVIESFLKLNFRLVLLVALGGSLETGGCARREVGGLIGLVALEDWETIRLSACMAFALTSRSMFRPRSERKKVRDGKDVGKILMRKIFFVEGGKMIVSFYLEHSTVSSNISTPRLKKYDIERGHGIR